MVKSILNVARKSVSIIENCIFPVKCPFCMKNISEIEFKNGICQNCRDQKKVVFFRDSEQGRTNPYIENISGLYVVAKYNGAMKDAMIDYKFKGNNWISTPFSRLVYENLKKCGALASGQIISYVPINGKRAGERGFDQSKLIASKLSSYTGLPCINLLKRKNDSAAKTSSENREERYLDSDKFTIDEKNISKAKGKGIILVDDILTTGSTLNSCSKLLVRAGCAYVRAAVVASGRNDILTE